jgi:hypothetical protein
VDPKEVKGHIILIGIREIGREGWIQNELLQDSIQGVSEEDIAYPSE